ncbi:MAG: siderophore ferric iron reductase [Paludibacterium sp.]|uniref:siderophore ferric iron reductase n=1 Tax=Paludibacterium sp. TaxID=1917523 RepID=UPI0026009CC1|nr:siderophore ferric iron reductase [Paludibacterium sp.]MBV8045747.1 siderophore ferric iron reductase [Paludibacterium sp.]MBV8648160.1 siderophore ferric iron reductase [Paludibacterium sp.]
MRLGYLLREVANAQPGLVGQVGAPSPELIVAGGAPATLSRLVGYWREAHPEAGPLYWASRSWTMLIWQPLYLLVWATHRCKAVPRLAGMAQRVDGGRVSGFVLGAHHPLDEARLDARIMAAGVEARALCPQLLADLGLQIRLHPKMAGRLQADCLLAALLAVARSRPEWTPEYVCGLAGDWLAAAGLAGQSGLCRFGLPGGGLGLGLERRVCCQHFRRADGVLCSSCPRWTAPEREARLREEWLC